EPDQQPGGQRAAEAKPESGVEEGAAHIAVGTAHQFDNGDFVATVFDSQPDSVADNQQYSEGEGGPEYHGEFAAHGHGGLKVSQPGGIGADIVHQRVLGQFAGEFLQRVRLIAEFPVRSNENCGGQRVAVKQDQKVVKPGAAAKIR